MQSTYPRIFDEFDRAVVTTEPGFVYDMLGGRVRASFKKGWVGEAAVRTTRPNLPAFNEWMVDWVACLLAAELVSGDFAIVEAGAGYGHWMSVAMKARRAAGAAGSITGYALEAEKHHYEWLLQNVIDNNLDSIGKTICKYGAAGADGDVYFPVIDDPTANYGASIVHDADQNLLKVPSYSLRSIHQELGTARISLLHVDIQGGEEDFLVKGGDSCPLELCDVVLVGTHVSTDLHESVRGALQTAGFDILIDWPRNSQVDYCGKKIDTNDGALLAVNTSTVDSDMALTLASRPLKNDS
ncbi:MAG: FkbM family methyltransferase [Pseudomonadota bacterium]